MNLSLYICGMKIENIVLNPIQKEIVEACEPLIVNAISRHNKWVDNIVVECFNYIQESFKVDLEKAKVYNEKLLSEGKDYSTVRLHLRKTAHSYVYNFITKVKGIKHGSAVYNFLSNIFSDNYSSYKHENVEEPKVFINEERLVKEKLSYEESYRSGMKFKLTRAIIKYVTSDYTKVENITIENGIDGFELTSSIFKGDVKEIIRTRAISAGGYNIQEYHYRYLTKVKKVS